MMAKNLIGSYPKGIHYLATGLLALAITAFANPLCGQREGMPAGGSERVYLHLDKLVYVAGEAIQYKVYILNGLREDRIPCSKVLYMTLADNANANPVSWRINLENNPVSGHYILPADMNAGAYVLRAYTNQMRNVSSNPGFVQPLLVMNLSESTPDTLLMPGAVKNHQPGNAAGINLQDYALQVSPSRPIYSGDETVQLEIRMDSGQQPDARANLSVSVSAVSPFQEMLQEADLHTCLEPFMANGESIAEPCTYRMEDKAFILAGRIRSRDNSKPVVQRKILLSATDSVSPGILYAETDSAGEFLFYVNRAFDNKELILQFADQSNHADYRWELEEKSGNANQQSFAKYWLKPEESAYLNMVKDLKLIEAVYAEKTVREPDTAVLPDPLIRHFYPPDWVVYPADFAEMSSFKELVDNILPYVRFSKRNDVYALQVLNEGSGLWEENRLLLLNGVPYSDFAYIATLGSKEIKRIEVITSNYMLGDLTLPGVVSIYTHSPGIPENYLKNRTVTHRNTVIPNERKPVTPETVSGMHLPDFRTVLYWEPELTLAVGETRVLTFSASQLKGSYGVRIRGLVGGKHPVSAYTSFEVK
jgi:hypothetical protein